MKSAFAVALLSSTFALAAFDANWGQAAYDEVPAADLTSNATSWTGPSVTAKSGKQYASGGETSWKVTQEGDDNQELVIFTTTHATVDGTAGIGDDEVTLMTCIPNQDVPATELRCIVQRHAKDAGEESHSSVIKTFYWDANTAFPVQQSADLMDWIPLSCLDQPECPWELVTDAEILQPGVEVSGKRQQYFQQGYLVTAGFYGASTMKAFFKTKNEVEDDDDKARLNRFKLGSSIAGKQYLQISSSINNQQDLELQELAVDIKYKAEPGAGEDDSAMSYGAAVGAVAIAISALAF